MKQSFDWVSPDADEEVLWSGKPRIQSIIPAVILGVLILPLAPLIIGFAYLRIRNIDFVVTSQGLYKKHGILSRNVQKISFDKVQNISFSQNLLGKYFNYGNIEISTAGGQEVEMRFESVNRPRDVQEMINKRIKGGKQSSEASRKELLEQILEQLKQVNRKLDQ